MPARAHFSRRGELKQAKNGGREVTRMPAERARASGDIRCRE